MRKKLTIIIAILAVFGVAYIHGQNEAQRMDNYARANNCTWHYDYYINEQPVCK